MADDKLSPEELERMVAAREKLRNRESEACTDEEAHRVQQAQHALHAELEGQAKRVMAGDVAVPLSAATYFVERAIAEGMRIARESEIDLDAMFAEHDTTLSALKRCEFATTIMGHMIQGDNARVPSERRTLELRCLEAVRVIDMLAEVCDLDDPEHGP